MQCFILKLTTDPPHRAPRLSRLEVNAYLVVRLRHIHKDLFPCERSLSLRCCWPAGLGPSVPSMAVRSRSAGVRAQSRTTTAFHLGPHTGRGGGVCSFLGDPSLLWENAQTSPPAPP